MEKTPIPQDEQKVTPETQMSNYIDMIDFTKYQTPKDAAIHISQDLGDFISKNFPSIANIYREKPLFSQSRIARAIFSEAFFVQHQRLAEAAVGIALRRLIPEEEYEQLAITRRQALEVRRQEKGYYQADPHREKSVRAAKIKHSGETPEERKESSDRLNLAQGKTPWTNDEINFLRQITTDPSYYHSSGQHEGKLNLPKIAITLNAQFGNNRTRKTLFRFLKRNS